MGGGGCPKGQACYLLSFFTMGAIKKKRRRRTVERACNAFNASKPLLPLFQDVTLNKSVTLFIISASDL